MDMKKEFDFSEHKPDTTTKHYFGKEELDGVVLHDKLDASKVPESDYATRKEQLAQSELDKFGKGVVLNHINHADLPVDANGKVADLAPPRGMYRDNHGNLRDLRELSLDDELYNPHQIANHPAVQLIKGLDADYDGISIPMRKPSRAEKSVSNYRNVMNGLIARASKK